MSTRPAPPPLPDKAAIAQLPAFDRLAPACMHLVADAHQAQAASAALRRQPVWGFDTESRPTFAKHQTSDGPHTVQLASTEQAWVFQLHDAHCRALVAQLLVAPGHLKVGFGLGDDCKRLQAKLGVRPAPLLDLDQIFRAQGYRRQVGVKTAVALLFGQCFVKSKKTSTSNWAAAQLSPTQLSYAAHDAWAALRVYQALELRHEVGSKTQRSGAADQQLSP